MSDVNISKFRAQVVRDGSKPATPGFVVSEGQSPTDPAGSGQNHLPVTIAAASTGLAITESQILGGAGTVAQYIRGDGSLADFPATTGGGSSVSYYLNGSVSQGTIGGVAYRELNRTPVFGAGTDISINADGYIASFITDALDPNKLLIPAGNWNFETYFSANSGGGSPTFYVELYKYNGTTFTLIATSSGTPELIAFGTNINPYFSTLAVPETVLALTDRLAVRFYVTHSGRTITLHTENGHLCQVITTFTTGLTALNGLTTQVQFFAVGTSGTDFAISSASDTHTFNLPTASGTNRGALSSADWSTFNAKQNALGFTPVPETRTITINGTTQDLSANRTYNVGTVTSVGLSSATSGVTIGSTPVTGSGTITIAIATSSGSQNGLLSSTDWTTFNGKQNALTLTTTGTSGAATLVGSTLNIPQYQAAGTYVTAVTASSPLSSSGGTTPNITIQQASGSQNGFLSSTDWTTFNNKQNALTNPVTGTGTTNYLPKFTGSTTVGNSQVFDNGTNVGIGTNSPSAKLDIAGGDLYVRTGGGIYANTLGPYSGNMTIALGGSGNNLIVSGGNLLVGTTTDAGYKLDVNGTAKATKLVSASNAFAGTLDFGTGSFKGIMDYTASTGLWSLNNQTAGSGTTAYFQFQTDSSPIVTMLKNGNVGIGITSPLNKLSVVSSNSSGYYNRTEAIAVFQGALPTLLIANDGNSDNQYAELKLGNNQSTYYPFSAYIRGVQGGGIDQYRLEFGTSASSPATTKMTINTNGNVLIGTSTDIGQRFQVSGGYIAQVDGGVRTFLGYDGTGSLVGTTTNHYFRFITNDTERMRITSGGNVLIGTTTTASRLTVQDAANTFVGHFSGNNQTNGVAIGTNGSNVAVIQGYTRTFSATNNIAMQTDGGNVLIGTTTDNGAKLNVNGTIRTANPTGSTSDGWLLGRALVSGSSTPDRWIRVQIGNLYYDILSRYIGSV